jgi:hypothetical protein
LLKSAKSIRFYRSRKKFIFNISEDLQNKQLDVCLILIIHQPPSLASLGTNKVRSGNEISLQRGSGTGLPVVVEENGDGDPVQVEVTGQQVQFQSQENG